MSIQVKIGLVLCAGLLFLHCSDDPIGGHLLDQPFSKENYVFPGTVVDPAGSPVQGVSISMGYAPLSKTRTAPDGLNKTGAQHAALDFRVFTDIYNMFEDPVKSLDLNYTAWDSTIFDSDPPWDHTDFNGDTVQPGLYFYNGICFDMYGQPHDSVTQKWFAVPGGIGTTDKEGRFNVPALPVFPVLLDDQGGTKRYFKGWVVLTCDKSGYQTAVDTVNVYEPIPPIVIRKVP